MNGGVAVMRDLVESVIGGAVNGGSLVIKRAVRLSYLLYCFHCCMSFTFFFLSTLS